MRFLIDECLTIDLVSIASQAGHEAQHVAHVGKAGWKDWNVARHAAAGDFVLVTNTTAPSVRYVIITKNVQVSMATRRSVDKGFWHRTILTGEGSPDLARARASSRRQALLHRLGRICRSEGSTDAK